jgi:Carboxypeptidase regulatory-like domain/TonB dependent receptor
MNRKCILGVMMFVFSALLAWAQTGTLSGTITNPDGKPVPAAVVTITNVSTGTSQKVVTGTDGNFMVAIPPGSYKVEVETAGFKRMTAEAVVITAGTSVRITAQLIAGPVTEVVQINADALDIQDTPPAIQRGFGQAPLQTLPVFDRNYEQLFNLMPGVTVPLSTVDAALGITFDPQRSRQFNTNGLPAYANNTTEEGTTLREPFTGVLTMQITPNTDIRELQETTSNYAADSGAAAGSINNVFSRPGTTGLHGELFGFNSNPYFQAGNPFNIVSNGSSTLHWWQTGAGVGGQIVPNHTFLYGNWEGTHYSSGNAQLATVPTDAMLFGNLSSFGTPIYNPSTGTPAGALRNPYFGGIIPLNQINPLAFGILAALPAPNLPGIVNNLSRVVPFNDNSSVANGRLDQHFTPNYSAFLSYGWSYFNAAQGSLYGPIVGSPTSSALRNQHATVAVVGNQYGLIGELRFTYNRYRNAIDPSNQLGLLSPLLGSYGFTSMPTINIQGFGTLGELPNMPNKVVDNTYQGAANFHWAQGIQNVRFGTDILATQSNGWTNYPFGPNGTLYFGPGPTLPAVISPYLSLGSIYPNSLAAFLTGSPVASGIFSYSNVPTYRQMLYGTYVADTLRLTTRLSLEVGLRWDIFGPTSAQFNNGAMVYNPTAGTITYSSGGGGSYDLRQLAPRIGVAYRPLEHTVIRASYGMYYFPVPNSFAGLNQTGVGTQAGLINGSYTTVPFNIPTLPIRFPEPPGATVAAPTIPLIAQTTGVFENPYTQSYFLMVQQDLHYGILADAAYVGNVVRQLPYSQSLNIAPPGTGPAGLPFATTSPIIGLPFLPNTSLSPVTGLGTGLTSNYNSLHINLTKRLSHGFGMAVAYTFSKALDYGTSQLNPFDRAANYGPADFNRQNMVTLSHHFDVPFGTGTQHLNHGLVGHILAGFQLNGMFQWGTGSPYSVLASPVSCNCPGVGSIFAAPVGPTGFINGVSSFNPALFTTPVPNTFGTASRNAYHGPNFSDYNLSLAKAFRITEQAKVEIRGEAFNLANSFNHGNPIANLASPSFGTATALGSGLGSGSSLVNGFAPRTFQVGARFLF